MSITITTINRILIQEDIEGLIHSGAPEDEYSDEAAQLAAALELIEAEQLTYETVLATLSLIWLKSFELSPVDMKLRAPALERVSERVILDT